MKTNKKILLCLSGVIIVALMISLMASQGNATLAAEIEENFTQMSNLSVEQTLSSNPYDYINNEYYDNIVALGVPAIEVLEENYHNGVYTGLNAYIAALAIQDIANINLYKCTGTDWETPEQFFEKWDETMQDLSNIFDKIANSDESMSDKIKQFENYGIFGKAFLTAAKETKNNSFEFSGEKIILEEKLNLDNVSTISTKQLAEVNDYLESITN